MNVNEIECTIRSAYEKSCHGDWSAIDDIRKSRDINTFYIYQVAMEAIFNNLKNYWQVSERDVYEWFTKNYESILGCNYEIIKRKNYPNHIPDFWLKFNDEFIPVECKLNDFNEKALNQLKRYMSVYETENGIAVGSKLTCELPKNIVFIKHNVA